MPGFWHDHQQRGRRGQMIDVSHQCFSLLLLLSEISKNKTRFLKNIFKRGESNRVLCHLQQRWLFDENYLGQEIMGQGIGEEF